SIAGNIDGLRAAQVRVEGLRIHQDAGVQQIHGVEEIFETLIGGNNVVGVRELQELTAGSTIAVFTRNRTAVAGDQHRGSFEEGTHSFRRIRERHINTYM